jgi:hypothetical protein
MHDSLFGAGCADADGDEDRTGWIDSTTRPGDDPCMKGKE